MSAGIAAGQLPSKPLRDGWAVIPRPGDQNLSQVGPAFLLLKLTAEPPSLCQVPINEVWYYPRLMIWAEAL